jgi:hypothetical protein
MKDLYFRISVLKFKVVAVKALKSESWAAEITYCKLHLALK